MISNFNYDHRYSDLLGFMDRQTEDMKPPRKNAKKKLKGANLTRLGCYKCYSSQTTLCKHENGYICKKCKKDERNNAENNDGMP